MAAVPGAFERVRPRPRLRQLASRIRWRWLIVLVIAGVLLARAIFPAAFPLPAWRMLTEGRFWSPERARSAPFVAMDADGLGAMWREHGSREVAPPAVDFAQEIVVRFVHTDCSRLEDVRVVPPRTLEGRYGSGQIGFPQGCAGVGGDVVELVAFRRDRIPVDPFQLVWWKYGEVAEIDLPG